MDIYDKNGTRFKERRKLSKNDVIKMTLELGHQPDVESALIQDSDNRSMMPDESQLQRYIMDNRLAMFTSSSYGNFENNKDFQVDDASIEASKEVVFTGGTIKYASSGAVSDIEIDNETDDPDWTLVKPIRMGKWEYWNLDVAASLTTSLNRGDVLPSDCGKDDALFYGFGRSSTPLNLTKTGLNGNNGSFTHSTCVEKDEVLVEESIRIITKHDVGSKIRSYTNWGLEPPTTAKPDWSSITDKKYDIIIAATPPFDKRTGCYWVKSQIRGAEKGIEADKDRTGTPPIPFGMTTEQYKTIAQFEDRCYDDNWGELNSVFRNAKSLLKPGGYLLTVHNTYASDIDTFKPYIEKCGLNLVEDGLLSRQAHIWPSARHWMMRSTLVGPLYPSNKYYMLCKI